MSSVEMAQDYVRRMVESETRGWGDTSNALRRLEARYKLSYWSLDGFRTGRWKTVEAGVFARIREAYIDLCERQVAKLQHEIAIEKALGNDEHLDDLEAEASALAAKIKAKRAAR